MRSAEVTRSVERAQERLRRVRAETGKALGADAVAPRPGHDLLAEPADVAPVRAIFIALSAAAAVVVDAVAGAWGAAAFLAAAIAVALAVGESRAGRARRLCREIDAEIDENLARLEGYVATQSRRARDEAGTLETAVTHHALQEGVLLARLAAVAVTCPACGQMARGIEFARRKGCPRCKSDGALRRPPAAAQGAGAEALADYAAWASTSQALAQAAKAARNVEEVARRAEREVRAGRAVITSSSRSDGRSSRSASSPHPR
jgi:hypothetical protein